MAAIDPDAALQVAKTVADIYGDAAARLLRLVAHRLARGIDEPGWAEAKLLELLNLRSDAQAVLAALAESGPAAVEAAVTTSAERGIVEAARELQVEPNLRARTNTAAVDALAREAVGQVQATHLRILRSTEDIYRRVVAETSAPGVVTGSETRRAAAQRALDRWATHGITGFVDRSGRRWELQSYAEMATRTAAGRAQVEGRLATYIAEGRDLVIVSDAPQECSACRPWEGRVLSISGADRRYPSVRQAVADGLLHANCRHDLRPYVEGLTKRMTHTADPAGDRARQEQRRLERGVRAWKRREAAAMTPDAQREARAKVREWQDRLRRHVEAHDLMRQRHREQVGKAR